MIAGGAFWNLCSILRLLAKPPHNVLWIPGWDTLLQALVEAIPHVIFRKSSQVESDVLGSWPQQKK
jgi:hypothetical protein